MIISKYFLIKQVYDSIFFPPKKKERTSRCIIYRPVETPQLSKQALSRGRSWLILTTLATSTTVYCAKLDTLKKWCTTSPFMSLNLLLWSLGMLREYLLYLNTEQLLLFLDLQSLHSLQFGRNTGTTMSPSFTSSTFSPALSTILYISSPK